MLLVLPLRLVRILPTDCGIVVMTVHYLQWSIRAFLSWCFVLDSALKNMSICDEGLVIKYGLKA